jgi:PAS domain S-box-containing protein/excisionase family DNA binding protein
MDPAIVPSARVDAAVLRASPDAIVSIDARGRVLEFNPAAERMFGYERCDVLGREMADLIVPPAARAAHRRGLRRLLDGGAPRMLDRRVELEAMRVDGSRFPAEIAIARMSGSTATYTGFVRDLTDHKLVEQAGGGATPAIGTAGGGAAHGPAGRETTLSLGQAARALGISTTTARRWADDERLCATRTSGGHRRFAASEVRRLLAARGRPAIAPSDPPRRALPALAELVEKHGAALADLSWRGLYGELRSGFFVEPDGVAAAARWLGALAAAAASADYEILHQATSALMRAAERSGATLLERHLALERFDETVTRALVRRSCPGEEVVSVRRLFAFLAQRQLGEIG